MIKLFFLGYICAPVARVRALTHSLNNPFKTWIRSYSPLLKTLISITLGMNSKFLIKV